jgi:hypothetical protein
MRDGTLISGKVTQVSDWEVSYIKADNPDGPVFSTDLYKVLSIKYANGTEQKFETPEVVPSPIPAREVPESYPQKANRSLSLHAGIAFPANEVWSNVAGKLVSKTGVGIGVKGVLPLSARNLGLFMSADFIYNDSKSDEREYLDDKSQPSIYNVPVILGFNYRYDADARTALWIEFGMGPNFRRISEGEISYSMEDNLSPIRFKEKTQSKTSTSFALQLGAGVMFSEKFGLGLNYYSTGRTSIITEITRTSASGESATWSTNTKVAADVFMLRLGYYF